MRPPCSKWSFCKSFGGLTTSLLTLSCLLAVFMLLPWRSLSSALFVPVWAHPCTWQEQITWVLQMPMSVTPAQTSIGRLHQPPPLSGISQSACLEGASSPSLCTRPGGNLLHGSPCPLRSPSVPPSPSPHIASATHPVDSANQTPLLYLPSSPHPPSPPSPE